MCGDRFFPLLFFIAIRQQNESCSCFKRPGCIEWLISKFKNTLSLHGDIDDNKSRVYNFCYSINGGNYINGGCKLKIALFRRNIIVIHQHFLKKIERRHGVLYFQMFFYFFSSISSKLKISFPGSHVQNAF